MTGMQTRRVLCMLLALMCLCTSVMIHSHGCLAENDALHVHRCADDCCTVCAFRALIICTLLFVAGRAALHRLISNRTEHRGAPPEESEGTLVQLKVKLSN